MGRLRFDNHELVYGETRKLEFDLSPEVGANSIESVTYSGEGLTFASPNVSGTDATVFVSGGEINREYDCSATCVLSSGETIVYGFTLEWKHPNRQSRRGSRK